MRNIILILIEVITCYVVLIMLYKKYKTDGVYIYIMLLGIISSIMNFKMISVMNVPIPLGFGVTMSILIGVNLMIQKRGIEELKPCIMVAIIPLIISYTILYLSALMANSNYNILSNVSYNNIFIHNIRINIALIVSMLFTIFIDGKIYYIIKKLQNKIILNNIFSIIIAEFFENIFFVVIAFIFDYEVIDLFLCIILRYTIKTTIGVFGTLPLYIASKYN